MVDFKDRIKVEFDFCDDTLVGYVDGYVNTEYGVCAIIYTHFGSPFVIPVDDIIVVPRMEKV